MHTHRTKPNLRNQHFRRTLLLSGTHATALFSCLQVTRNIGPFPYFTKQQDPYESARETHLRPKRRLGWHGRGGPHPSVPPQGETAVRGVSSPQTATTRGIPLPAGQEGVRGAPRLESDRAGKPGPASTPPPLLRCPVGHLPPPGGGLRPPDPPLRAPVGRPVPGVHPRPPLGPPRLSCRKPVRIPFQRLQYP